MFFAVLNFTFAGAIGVVGILTLMKASQRKEIMLAALPLLFALHQFTQGFVWLGMHHLIAVNMLHLAESIFIFYAQGLLQLLIPLAVWLIEPEDSIRKKILGLLAILGALLTIYTMWGLVEVPTSVYIKGHALVYVNPWTAKGWVAALYILTTCGSLVFSSSISIQIFGWLNLIGLTAVYFINHYAFTALWCLYAASVSAMLYFYFVERRVSFLQALKVRENIWDEKLEEELIHLENRYPNALKKIKRQQQKG